MGYILEVKQFVDDLQSLGLRKESNQKRWNQIPIHFHSFRCHLIDNSARSRQGKDKEDTDDLT